MDAGSDKTTFFDKTYREAIGLLLEAEDYLSKEHPIAAAGDNPTDTLRVRGEAFRLTTRMMQVVAWLMTQRAVHEGELTAIQVANDPKYRLSATKVCRDDSSHHHPAIPAALEDMLDRSLNLYIRVERLDEMLCRSIH